MKQIDDYVESLFKNYGKSKDVMELKEETRTHLLESVNELLAEGKTEKESVSLAIERFGDNDNLNSELESVLHVKRIFAKGILRMAFALLTLAVIATIGIVAPAAYYDHGQSTVLTKVLPILRNSTPPLTSQQVKQITQVVRQNDFVVKYIAITDSKTPDANPTTSDKLDLIYPSNSKVENIGWGYNIGYWHMQEEVHPYPYPSPARLKVIPIALVLGYWILFAIWASINAYHRKRLNGAWIVAFACLNFFGWILFRSTKQSKNVQTA